MRQHPPAVITKALCLYIDTNKTMQEIADEVGIPKATLDHWRSTKGWVEKKKAFLEDLQANTDMERRAVVMGNVVPVIKRHLTVSGALEDATLEVIQNSKDKDGKTKLTPRDISDLGKGLNQTTAVSARVVGIDKSSAVEQVGGNNFSVGAGGLIQIGLTPLPDKPPEPNAIEAEYEEPHKPFTDFPEA